MSRNVIDHDARRTFSTLLRRLAAGLITNDDFETAVELLSDDTRDRGLLNLIEASQGLYDGVCTGRLAGRNALTPETRRFVAVMVLWLRSTSVQSQAIKQSEPGPLGSFHLFGGLCVLWLGLLLMSTGPAGVISALSLLARWLYSIDRESTARHATLAAALAPTPTWPFITAEEFNLANRTRMLLGGPVLS